MNYLVRLLSALALLTGIALVAAPTASATGQETCPDGDGWTKVNVNALSYTFTPPAGTTVTENCYKASTTVIYGSGPTVTSTVTNDNGKLQNISHASFKTVANHQCPDGSDPGDLNGDGMANAEDCGWTPPPTCESDPSPDLCPNPDPDGERETRDKPSVTDCALGTVTVVHEERSRVMEWLSGQWQWAGWSDWTEYDRTVRDTTTQECPPDDEVVPFPEPQQNDPCGPGNATWVVPADTDEVHWVLTEDGRLIGTTQPGYVWPNGETINSWGFALDSETACPPTERAIPAKPLIEDGCATGDAYWVLPEDGDGLDWSLVDGVLSVTITAANTVFPGGLLSHVFGPVVETITDQCPPTEVTPVDPVLTDPTCETRGSLVIPEQPEGVRVHVDGVEVTEFPATYRSYLFSARQYDVAFSATEGLVLTSDPSGTYTVDMLLARECDREIVDIPAQPDTVDPCGPDNIRWVLPQSTDVLVWQVSEANGDAVVSIREPGALLPDRTFPDGSIEMRFALPADSGEKCETDEPKDPREPRETPDPKDPATPVLTVLPHTGPTDAVAVGTQRSLLALWAGAGLLLMGSVGLVLTSRRRSA